jgi:HemK-related putative methylase
MSFLKVVRRLYSLVFYHGWVKRKIARTVTTDLLGFSLTVPPSVFHPKFYFTSKFLGEFIQSLPLKGKKVLDIGCGSGILSLVAAAAGASVTSIDINPAAVVATKENARRNNFSKSIASLESDLFVQLNPNVHQFDYIITNPPFYPGEAETVAEKAFKGGNANVFMRRLAESAPGFLLPDGAILMVLSSDTDVKKALQPFEERRFVDRYAATRQLAFERLFIVELRPSSAIDLATATHLSRCFSL